MILAVDCGSTNLKAALYDSALNRLAAHSVPVEYSRRDAVRAEFEAERLWSAFLALINAVVHQAGCTTAAISQVALGSQAQSFCLLDSAGQALMPFISWMDTRAEEESALLTQAFGRDFHRHSSFSSPFSSLEISKLLWVRRHLPQVWAHTRHLVSVPGFFCLRLAGVNPMDSNLAAMNGLVSMVTGDWWRELLDYGGVPGDWLPTLAPAGHGWRGRFQAPGWPDADVTLVLAGNDHTAGALGNGCRPGEIIVTFGTALVAYRRTGAEPGPYHPDGCWGPYPGGGYYELAVCNHGCSALDWARSILLPEQPPSSFVDLAATAGPGSGGVRFYPERARTESAWLGNGTPADRARAVLEGILFALRRLLADNMNTWPVSGVCALGGGVKSQYWMQMAADILGCPVRTGAGDSLLGAAALAANRNENLKIQAGDARMPDPARCAQYESIFVNWKKTNPAGTS